MAEMWDQSSREHSAMACNVVAVPYPGRGHVNVMMNLCKLLVTSHHDLLVTFVITEEWLGIIGSDDRPPRIRFATIPNVLPSEVNRASDMVSFVGATQTKMEEPFEGMLDRLQVPTSLIVADTFLNWAVDVGNRRNIPVASLWPMPASVFSVFYHFDLLVRNGDFPFQLSESGDERVDYIPGIPSIRLADLPSILQMKDRRLVDLVLQVFPNVSRVQYLLFNTVTDLEFSALEALKHEFTFPVYTLGPVIPFPQSNLTGNDDDYFFWLNSQTPSSVLYISLGSFLSVSAAQMDEIADGLQRSGVRFLWVARGEAARLQERCGKVGRVVPWCDQLRVLCHPAIGGFWTHCGWNSTTEGIYAGVPIIAFPILMDQTTVRKHVVEDWRIGWDVSRQKGDGNLVTSVEIGELVKGFMDLESVERKEMIKRVKEVQKTALDAIYDGGCSKKNLTCFLDEITSSRNCSI